MNVSYKAITSKMNKINWDDNVLRCDENCALFEVSNILRTVNNNINEHMVRIVEEFELKNIIYMQCILDCSGSTKQGFRFDTNMKDSYSV